MMGTRESEEQVKRWEKNQALLKRLQREEASDFQRSRTDPEFTVRDIANITGKSERWARQLLRDAGVGTDAIRQLPTGGARYKTIVVRYSQLARLISECKYTVKEPRN